MHIEYVQVHTKFTTPYTDLMPSWKEKQQRTAVLENPVNISTSEQDVYLHI
jgi:hypothetical protein